MMFNLSYASCMHGIQYYPYALWHVAVKTEKIPFYYLCSNMINLNLAPQTRTEIHARSLYPSSFLFFFFFQGRLFDTLAIFLHHN
jgi:hypothetical protein